MVSSGAGITINALEVEELESIEVRFELKKLPKKSLHLSDQAKFIFLINPILKEIGKHKGEKNREVRKKIEENLTVTRKKLANHLLNDPLHLMFSGVGFVNRWCQNLC